MPSAYSQSKTTILAKKDNIYRGIMLSLTIFLAFLQPIPKAEASPIEQLKLTDTTVNQESTPKFGTKGQKRWYTQGAFATTLDNQESFPRRFGLVGAGLSKFFINGHSVNLELNTIYFDQPGNNAIGLNLALLGRWHIIRQQNWSLFVGGGAGVMGTTSDVPEKGASFNFTPQAGAGATIALKNDRRLMLGLNWHHISHADLFGNNPGRDSIMGYVGVDFPR